MNRNTYDESKRKREYKSFFPINIIETNSISLVVFNIIKTSTSDVNHKFLLS